MRSRGVPSFLTPPRSPIGFDGRVLHRDANDPQTIYLYLLSYGRDSLIGHWVVKVGS